VKGIEAEIVAFFAATSKNKTRTKLRASESPDWPMNQTITAQATPWSASAKMNFRCQQRALSVESSAASTLPAKWEAKRSAPKSRASQSKTVSTATHVVATAAASAPSPAIARPEDRRPFAKRRSSSRSKP